MSENSQCWRVGGTTITCIVEAQYAGVPAQFFFPEASATDVVAHQWLVPDFAGDDGAISLRIQAFVISIDGRTVLVDPCVGNGKRRSLPFWNDQNFPWLERFGAAGFDPAAVDTVVHTHLHADHVGWDTHLVDGRWTPTFPNARHVYVGAELEHCRGSEQRPADDVYGDSVEPILAAGLADVVDGDTDLGDGLRLFLTPGHTPGHASLDVSARGERAVITGDLMHHPVQFARPEWAEIADSDPDEARATRASFIESRADDGALVLGTHFPSHPAGRVRRDGDGWRFHPEAGTDV